MPRLGGETGFIVLTGAVAISAWIGGLTGGLTATVVAGIANAAIFVGPDGTTFELTQIDVARTRPVPRRRRRRLDADGLAPRVPRPAGGDRRRDRDDGVRPRTPRRAPRARAGGVRDRLLGVGRAHRRPALVRGDLPAARARAHRRLAVLRALHRDDPSGRSRRVPGGRRRGARRRAAARPPSSASSGRTGPSIGPTASAASSATPRATPSGWSAPGRTSPRPAGSRRSATSSCSTSAGPARSARRSSTSSRTSCGPRSRRSSA